MPSKLIILAADLLSSVAQCGMFPYREDVHALTSNFHGAHEFDDSRIGCRVEVL